MITNWSKIYQVSFLVQTNWLKSGVGRLVLEADNANSGGVDIRDGTLVIGNSSNDTDAGSGNITIDKGKLEVLSGDTVGNTIAGGSGEKYGLVVLAR